MPNHLAAHALPGGRILARNAKVDFEPAKVRRLMETRGSRTPTMQSIISVLSGGDLSSKRVVEDVREGLRREILGQGTHICAHCAAILTYDTPLRHFGRFLSDLLDRTEYRTTDVVQDIAAACSVPESVIRELAQGITFPYFVSQSVCCFSVSTYPTAARFFLSAEPELGSRCHPTQDQEVRRDIQLLYVARFCGACQITVDNRVKISE